MCSFYFITPKANSEFFREARDENGIRKPKAVIQKLKKASSWYVAKLKRIHKLAGFEVLRSAYKTKKSTPRDWFRGYFTFQSKTDVLQRFEGGKPLSCFLVGDDATCLHVAVHSGIRTARQEDDDDIFFITMKCKPSTMHKRETGVHFCRFETDKSVHSAKKKDLNISMYALMLPYLQKERQRIPFQMQYTVIYSDWEVLRCDLHSNPKGLASTNNRLFNLME